MQDRRLVGVSARLVGGDAVRADRFVVCHNPDHADRDAFVRGRLVAHLEQLINGGSHAWPKSKRDEPVDTLRAKPGLRRYLHRTPAGCRASTPSLSAASRISTARGCCAPRTVMPTPDDLAAAYKQPTGVERG